jgi:hypothetical protein
MSLHKYKYMIGSSENIKKHWFMIGATENIKGMQILIGLVLFITVMYCDALSWKFTEQ